MDTINHTKSASLHEIITELPGYPKQKSDIADKHIIILEKDTGEILDELPVIRLFRKLRFFEINRHKVVFDIPGPKLKLPFENALNPFILNISYDARIADKGIFSLVRFVNEASSVSQAVNDVIYKHVSSFAFDHPDFVREFKKYKPVLEQKIIQLGTKIGLELKPYLNPNIENILVKPEIFYAFECRITSKTRDAQSVEIKHDLALTLVDEIKFSLSGVSDIKEWGFKKLEQFTNNAIIEMSYAEVLIGMQDSVIKGPMREACLEIGYELRQLVTAPGLDIEKFYFETAGNGPDSNTDYCTKDQHFRLAINIIVSGKMDRHDDRTKAHIRPGFDIIAHMKKIVISAAREYIDGKTPDECFFQRYDLENMLSRHIKGVLEKSYGYTELGVLIKFLETDLSRRIALLQERPWEVKLIADWTERRFSLWFRVQGVSPDGWYRFRANNYTDRDEEMKDIARIIKNGIEGYILRSSDINSKMIGEEFNSVRTRIRTEFGLEISMHDFREDLNDEEILFARNKKDEFEERHRRK